MEGLHANAGMGCVKFHGVHCVECGKLVGLVGAETGKPPAPMLCAECAKNWAWAASVLLDDKSVWLDFVKLKHKALRPARLWSVDDQKAFHEATQNLAWEIEDKLKGKFS